MVQNLMNPPFSAVALSNENLCQCAERIGLRLQSHFVKFRKCSIVMFANWQHRRMRNANLKFLSKLDSAVLRDVGLTKADIALLSNGPLHFGRSIDGYHGLLSFENDLRRNAEIQNFLGCDVNGGA